MNFKQDRAIYLQIADHITENILSRKWKENDRIPSVRDLAVSVEVNPNTVAHTYNYLQEKGIIYNQRGIGYFIAGNGLKKTQELKKESFIKEELYQMFKSIDLLGMTFDDIKQIYDDYKLEK
ncbi:MAG TPA: GntR family transcriptional regulator [Bacillota bacterium]|nr:GntR family transcriptional regulator [Bacillota bacterium]